MEPRNRPTSAMSSPLGRFLELAIGHHALEALLDQLFGLFLLQLLERLGERLAQRLRGGLGVAVRAAERLGHDLVDQPERLQPAGGDSQHVGRLGRLVGAAPQDRRAALRRDHRIRRVLQHQHRVAHRDGERAARAALADHAGDDWGAEPRPLEQIAADGCRLAALLGVDPRVGAGRVDEGEHRERELLGQLHQAQRLAVALGLGHAEVAQDLLLGIAALLVADDHAGRVAEARQAADDRGVVGEGAVAVQLLEMREQHLHIIQRVRPLRMARHLRHLPGRQLAVDVLGKRLAALGEPLDLLRDVDRGVVRHVAQLLDALLELGDRLLEFEERGLHRRAILADPFGCQYSTGNGSSERHRYQVATERQGRQVSPSLAMVFSAILRFLKYALRMPFCSPRSSSGNTSGRSRLKMRNISAVQRPMPRTWVSSAMTASSSMSGQRCTWIAPSRKCCARSAMYSTLRSDRPQARSSLLFLARTLCRVTAPAQRQTLSQTLCAALTEICWPTMARASVTNGSPRRARNTFGRERMMAAMTGSFRASARLAPAH